jgi:hypothetical protein
MSQFKTFYSLLINSTSKRMVSFNCFNNMTQECIINTLLGKQNLPGTQNKSFGSLYGIPCVGTKIGSPIPYTDGNYYSACIYYYTGISGCYPLNTSPDRSAKFVTTFGQTRTTETPSYSLTDYVWNAGYDQTGNPVTFSFTSGCSN